MARKTWLRNSPEFEKLEVLNDRLKVNFKNTGGGLKTRDGKAPSHFEVDWRGLEWFSSC